MDQEPGMAAQSGSHESLEAETARVRAWSRLSGPAVALLLIWYLADFLANRFLGADRWTKVTSETGIVTLIVIGWSLCITLLVLSQLLPGRRRRRTIVKGIASNAALTDFPKLVQATKLEDGPSSRMAVKALRALIPLIDRPHSGLINDDCRRYIRGKLRFPQEGFLYRDILQSCFSVSTFAFGTGRVICKMSR